MKKGQLHTWAIIGFIIAVLVVTVYAFREEVLSIIFGKEQAATIIVPDQARNIKQFTESCLQSITKEGLTISGQQGGYIDIPVEDDIRGIENPLSNSLALFVTQGPYIPYWFYESSNGIAKLQQPTLQMIEQELDSYIENKLAGCLNNYETFTNQGFSITQAKPNAIVKINNEEVLVTLKYPITLQKDNFQFTFTAFTSQIPSLFGSLYKAASEIFSEEQSSYFLEKFTLDLLPVYDEIPNSGVDANCQPKTWSRQRSLDALAKIIATNTQSITIEDTIYNKQNKHFIYQALSSNSPASAAFHYSPDWPIFVDIITQDNEVLSGESFTQQNALAQFLGNLFCLSTYNFVYDIRYPMLITLNTPENEIFQFATQVIIDNNQPRQNRISSPVYDTTSTACRYPITPLTIQTSAYSANGNLIPLEGVSIKLKCITATCALGSSIIKNGIASLQTTSPACTNGLIEASKEGYHKSTMLTSTTQPQTLTMFLEKINEFALKIKVLDNGNIRDPYPSETFIVSLEDPLQQFSTSVIYPETKKLPLIPGSYDTSITLTIPGDNIKIQTAETDFCVTQPKSGLLGIFGVTEQNCKKQPSQEIELSTLTVGGANMHFNIQRAQLASSKEITLHAARLSTPTTQSQMANIQNQIASASQQLPQPVLS